MKEALLELKILDSLIYQTDQKSGFLLLPKQSAPLDSHLGILNRKNINDIGNSCYHGVAYQGKPWLQARIYFRFWSRGPIRWHNSVINIIHDQCSDGRVELHNLHKSVKNWQFEEVISSFSTTWPDFMHNSSLHRSHEREAKNKPKLMQKLTVTQRITCSGTRIMLWGNASWTFIKIGSGFASELKICLNPCSSVQLFNFSALLKDWG